MLSHRTDPSGLRPRRRKSAKSKALAKFDDIRKYRDQLVAKEKEIEQLRQEIKSLTILQKRQVQHLLSSCFPLLGSGLIHYQYWLTRTIVRFRTKLF